MSDEPLVWLVEVPEGDAEVQTIAALYRVLDIGGIDIAAQQRVVEWLSARVEADRRDALHEQ